MCVVVLVVAACLGAPAAAWPYSDGVPGAREDSAGVETAIFYYPWFGTADRDGAFTHWHGGKAPPDFIASDYYPVRGPYSSADTLVLGAQMEEIAAAGISTVIVSWWGRGTVEDERLPLVIAAAKVYGLAVAAHVEPYAGRTVASVTADIAYLRTLGISDFYVWSSVWLPDADWAAMNAGLDGVRVFANTNLPGKAAAGGFDGVYTYDVLLYDGRLFARLCAQAHRLRLLCAPSVGPGYDARRATGDTRLKPRRDGATYDAMWRGAIRSRADVVTVTSYNEWHEGTQIEPARHGKSGYESYEGAWGLSGAVAERSYLERTGYWTARFARAQLGLAVNN
jgi:glycoprotein endo-alpha-1,2-mannosidase